MNCNKCDKESKKNKYVFLINGKFIQAYQCEPCNSIYTIQINQEYHYKIILGLPSQYEF